MENERQKIVEPLLVKSDDVAKMLGLSRSAFYSFLSSGRIGPMALTFGKSKRFSVDELRRWVQAGCPNREQWIKTRNET